MAGGAGRGPGQGRARRRPAAGSGVHRDQRETPARAQAWARRPPPENRLYFADYRDVDGLKWPFRLRRAIGPDTIEETTFDRFRINTKIDPKRFEVSK